MLLIALVKFLFFFAFCESMTMKQIKNTGKMMRKTCQPKNNAEDEKIDPINEGIFIDEKEVKCYIACIMKMANTIASNFHIILNETRNPVIQQYIAKDLHIDVDATNTGGDLMKNGKLNYEAALKQVDLLLPEDIKEPAKEAITACRKVADAHKDICDASFHVTKCIYNHNPSIFFFP